MLPDACADVAAPLPAAGDIAIDGRSALTEPLEKLRSGMAGVPQEPALYRGAWSLHCLCAAAPALLGMLFMATHSGRSLSCGGPGLGRPPPPRWQPLSMGYPAPVP